MAGLCEGGNEPLGSLKARGGHTKHAVVPFMMKTGPDCLAEHLYRMNCTPSDRCIICRDTGAVQNKNHLEKCTPFTSDNIAGLYWEATRKIMQIK
ncbi:hypothetical protein ANN_19292 [Periplaneta americana]|uniref:Uncharacterized protein n=1 Tax=Periplaneta americana TaxID=6978 RepID=A0ABQ8SAD3_PERAM|nr:hypothetical protein ANN_19292 [Periplaneta americana]